MRISTTQVVKKIRKSLAVMVFWLAAWQLAAAGVGRELILPPPVSVIKKLFELCVEKNFWLTAGASLLRIGCGFVSGVAAGVLLAVLTRASRLADALFSPVIRIIRATPVASFIILVLLWVTRALVPALMSALMVIPIVWAELSTAISETDPGLLEMARAYRFGKLKTLRFIYIPSATPQFISACLTAQGLSWKSGIAAEVLCLPRSAVGTELYNSKIYLETPSLFAWTAVIIIISFIVEKLCKLIFQSLQNKSRHPAISKRQQDEPVVPSSGAIRFRDVSLSYGEKTVLDGFDLNIGFASVTCLSGPSGCGKTTLLHVLAGLTKPRSGEIHGIPDPPGIMFQEDRLLPWLSAAENVMVVSDRETAEFWLGRMGLEKDLNVMPTELSGGMRRRVALARALAYRPALLLLDEPFKGLDASLSAACANLIKELDIHVIAVTHSEDEIKLLGGKVLRFEGPPLKKKD